MKHVAGGYRESIRHVRHEIRPKLRIPIGEPVEYPVYHADEPAENVLGQILPPSKNGMVAFERHIYYAHQYMVPTWVVERIEVDDVAPAIHEYGYYIVHTAYFWSRILRTDVLMQMDRYGKTENVSEIEEAVNKTTEVQRDPQMRLDYTEDASQYPLVPEVRPNEP